MQRKNSRQSDLDFVRIISIIAVIVIHGIANAVILKSVDSSGWATANLIDSFSRWAVPVFLMLSGALLIRPMARFEAKEFFKKRFSRILIPLAAWPVIYTLWYAFISDSQPNWQKLFLDFMGGTNTAPHLYFLFIIAGLYLITPLINIVRHATTDRQFLWLSIAIIVATTTWYSLETLLPGHGISFNALSQFIPYIGYFMLGSSLKYISFKRASIPITLFVITALLMSITTYFTAIKYGPVGNGLFFYSYFSVLTAIMSPLAFFSLRAFYNFTFDKIKNTTHKYRAERSLQILSDATFGVYLIHMIVLTYLPALLPLNTIGIRGATVFIFLTIILSFAISLIIVRIPYLRRLIT